MFQLQYKANPIKSVTNCSNNQTGGYYTIKYKTTKK